ncbi:MAG: hypothetical protein CSA33_05090 [Desulfobulbus propionicus]|nr:MAG: hypothetical protein CSA33_05090 [Desulfobulbus propionicus]
MLTEKKIAITAAVEARKEKIDREGAWKILASAHEILIGRGKKISRFTPSSDNQEEILKLSLGRSGSLRAPTLVIGNMVIVGYNDEMYRQLFA